jgi:hypothetical protein
MNLHHLSFLEWYFAIAVIFIPINFANQALMFLKDRKGLEPPYTEIRCSNDGVHFAPVVGDIFLFALVWPFTLLFGYLGIIFMTALFALSELLSSFTNFLHRSSDQ